MMVDEFIDDIHVALLASTGNVVMGVFHTLLAGKAGQCVPGRSCPPVRAPNVVAAVPRPTAVATPEELTTAATRSATSAVVDAHRRVVV